MILSCIFYRLRSDKLFLFKFVLFGFVFLRWGGTNLQKTYVSLVPKLNPIQSHLRSLTLNVYSLGQYISDGSITFDLGLEV